MDYEEVYPSGHKDQESPSEERSLFASSSSSTNEDMEMADPEVFDDVKERIKFVVGADGLREFNMLPEWTVNNFKSTIKEKHFNTLRANFQIPDNIPIRLPYKAEKCYYEGVESVCSDPKRGGLAFHGIPNRLGKYMRMCL